MAKKDKPGLTAKAPEAKERVRNGKRGQKQANADKQFQYGGLNKDQSQVVNNINQSDIGMTGFNNQQMPGVFNAYAQPWDQSGMPQSPWAQDQSIKDMETQYYDRAVGNYDRSMADQYQQEDAQFEQEMHNRGIPLGSDLYNKMKKQTADQRAGAKQNAMDSAYFNAGQNASNWNNIATSNFQNAYGFEMDNRNRPASEYANIQGLISGMPGQNLGYSQGLGLQQNDQAFQKYIFDHTPKGGSGGGGGGGGGGAMWQQYGFSSPMEYDAYKQQQARDAQSWEWANNPQYKQQKGPSPWSSALGQIASIGFGSWAGGGFKGL